MMSRYLLLLFGDTQAARSTAGYVIVEYEYVESGACVRDTASRNSENHCSLGMAFVAPLAPRGWESFGRFRSRAMNKYDRREGTG